MDVEQPPVPPRVPPGPGLVESVVAAYSLPGPSRWVDLGGHWTTNLRLDHPGRPALVVRAHRASTTPQRLELIQSARDAARSSGLPVPETVPGPDGRGYCSIADGTLVEVEEHVAWDTPMRTLPHLRTGFAALARLHDALRPLRPGRPVASPPHATYLDPDEVVAGVARGAARMRGWGDPVALRLADDVQRHCEEIAGREDRLRHDQVRQLVHGDFWDDNVVFRDGRLAGLLDFDFLGERDRVDELALTLWFHLLEPGNGPPGEQARHRVGSLVDAYDAASVLPLTATERERLPLAVARQPAWIAGSWIPAVGVAHARALATDLAARLPTATAVLADLARWTSALA